MKRTRSRSRGGGGPSRGVVVLLIVVVAVGGVVPAISYDSASVPRGTSVDVVADDKALIAVQPSDGVPIGTTDRLVNVTNQFGQSLTVTVSVEDESYGDLVVAGTNEGDSVQFSLAAGGTEQVSFDAVCDESLTDNRVAFFVNGTIGSANGSVLRSVDLEKSGCGLNLVYTTPSSGALRLINNESGITPLQPDSVDVIAPQAATLDGDGRTEVPFVNGSSGDIWITDANNDTEKLFDASTLNATLGSGAEHKKSVMAVGTWNGSETSVFFVNDDEKVIYRVNASGGVTKIEKIGDGASAVLGTADLDGDGAKELAFVSGSQYLHYLEDNGDTFEKISGGKVGTNNGVGAGAPADFDGDGTRRIPHVDGSNNLMLITGGGAETKLVSGVDKAPVGSYDWDGDGLPEVVYRDGGQLYYADDIGSGVTTHPITDANGNTVSAKGETGAA